MDLLSSMGLINYFGKQTDLKELKISPILFKKGPNKIALYGLSHIRDERLERLFRDRKVRMYRPQEDEDEWFNIFVCHQNRVRRPGTKYLSEKVIPDYMMLTIWGHEHESLIDPVPKLSENQNQNYEKSCGYISQPGNIINYIIITIALKISLIQRFLSKISQKVVFPQKKNNKIHCKTN